MHLGISMISPTTGDHPLGASGASRIRFRSTPFSVSGLPLSSSNAGKETVYLSSFSFFVTCARREVCGSPYGGRARAVRHRPHERVAGGGDGRACAVNEHGSARTVASVHEFWKPSMMFFTSTVEFTLMVALPYTWSQRESHR